MMLALLRPETFCRLLSRQRPRVLWRLQGFLLVLLLQAMPFNLSGSGELSTKLFS